MEPTNNFNGALCSNYIDTLAGKNKSDAIGVWQGKGQFLSFKHEKGSIMKCNFIFSAFLKLINCMLPDSWKIDFNKANVQSRLQSFQASPEFRAAELEAEDILDGNIEINNLKLNKDSDFAKMLLNLKAYLNNNNN